MSDVLERRKFKRCSIKIPLNLSDDVSTTTSHTIDLSLGGTLAYSKRIFVINSKVYMTLSIPKGEKVEEEEVRVIGEVLRVDEITSDNNSSNAVGIEFKTIKDSDVNILKTFLKKVYYDEKRKREEEKIINNDDQDKIELNNLIEELSHTSDSNMSFLDKLDTRGDYSSLVLNISRWTFKAAFIVLFFYVTYHILIFIFDLINLH